MAHTWKDEKVEHERVIRRPRGKDWRRRLELEEAREVEARKAEGGGK